MSTTTEKSGEFHSRPQHPNVGPDGHFQQICTGAQPQWPSLYDFTGNTQEYPNYEVTSTPYMLDSNYSYTCLDQPFIPNNISYAEPYLYDYSAPSIESLRPRTYPRLGSIHASGVFAEGQPPPIPHPLRQQKHQSCSESSTLVPPENQAQPSGGLCQLFTDTGGDNMAMDNRARHYSLMFPNEPEVLDSHANHSRSNQPRFDERCQSEPLNDDINAEKLEPYAKLIYRALMEAPGHTMVLRDIYSWFAKNTDKAEDKKATGWKNSIRHNLSMNGAFKKVDPPGEDARKGNLWQLTESAIREGVKSTTRYRSKVPNKRGGRSVNPAPHRQVSGSRGGHAARKSARPRRPERLAPFLFSNDDQSELALSYPGMSIESADACFADMSFDSNRISPPYFMQVEPTSRPAKQEDMPGLIPSRPAHGQPDQCSPDTYRTEDVAYLLQCNEGESLFYNSPDSGNEPMTPPPVGGGEVDTSMDTSSFFHSDPPL